MTLMQRCSWALRWLTVFVAFIPLLDVFSFCAIDQNVYFSFGFTLLKWKTAAIEIVINVILELDIMHRN